MKSFLFFFLCCSVSGYSQVALSNLSYSTRDVPSMGLEDPMKDSAFTNLTFNVGNLKSGDQISFKAGSTQGKEDIHALNMEVVVKGGKTYLAYGADWFPVENGKVSIHRVIPKTEAAKSTFAAVEAKDKTGKKYNSEIKQQVK
jgi:hypothetical protein